MIYNLKNKIESQNATERLNWLISKQKKIELTEKRKLRSLSQNAYQHVLFAYYGLQAGYTATEVKQDIFKRHICRDVFVRVKKDIQVCRSTADLSTKETAVCIDRFIDRAMIDLGIRLPTPLDHDKDFLEWCREETERYSNRRYL